MRQGRTYHIDRRDVRDAMTILKKCREQVHQDEAGWSFEAWRWLMNAELYLRDCLEHYSDYHDQPELEL